MKKLIMPYLASNLVLLFFSCASNSGSDFSKIDREKLMKTHNNITTPIREHPENIDCNALVESHYAEGAISMPPNTAPLICTINR